MQRHNLDYLLAPDVTDYRDRDDYKDRTGEQAPPFNPDLAPKYWEMTDAVPGTMSFKTIDQTDGKYVDRTIPGAFASRVNLPGRYYYPSYSTDRTSGAFVDIGSRRQFINGRHLANVVDANFLIEDILSDLPDLPISTDSLIEIKYAGGAEIQYVPEESRRLYRLILDGNGLNVGLLLQIWHRWGVNHPGTWSRTSYNDLSFAPIDVETSNDMPRVDTPYRSLKEGEKLVRDMGGWKVQIGEGPVEDGVVDGALILQKLDQIIALLSSKREDDDIFNP